MTRANKGKLSLLITDQDYRPIQDVDVTILDSKGNPVDHALTNNSGKINEIELDAPDIALSLSPTEQVPYTPYNLRISKKGYDIVEVIGVQNFPKTSSIQEISLVPSTSRSNVRSIYIDPSTLLVGNGKMDEKEINYIVPNKGSNFSADSLKSPMLGLMPDVKTFIPPQIIIHDGHPNDPSAKNYTVDFKSYIKNVASSEVYPTWNEDALKANILCIISFTLNRIKTEFYRGKGKTFTITSSTAFDHKWIPGRNIFLNIDHIVESMFTEYLAVDTLSLSFPYLAQYCDGKRVKCPDWFSQWGSVDLANKGMDYYAICRHYYGDKVSLEHADVFDYYPESYPGKELRMGSRGDDVKKIQEYINVIADHYPAIEKMTVDGIYGPHTKEQVAKFQGIFNLDKTGVVDHATWYKISDKYIKMKDLVRLPLDPGYYSNGNLYRYIYSPPLYMLPCLPCYPYFYYPYRQPKTYVNKELKVQFQYPTSWLKISDYQDRYGGSDGFFQVTASTGSSLESLAKEDAYHNARPYGSNPVITSYTVAGRPSKLITPSSDQAKFMNNQSALIITYPSPVTVSGTQYSYLILWSDAKHIKELADSLQFL